MKELEDLGKELKHYTNADTFPVSIKFLRSKEEIPEGARSVMKDLNKHPHSLSDHAETFPQLP